MLRVYSEVGSRCTGHRGLRGTSIRYVSIAAACGRPISEQQRHARSAPATDYGILPPPDAPALAGVSFTISMTRQTGRHQMASTAPHADDPPAELAALR